MIWTTWRQHRAEAGVGVLILLALGAGLIAVGNIARARARGLGLPSCSSGGGDCTKALDALHRDFHSIPPFTAALVAFPLLAGMFWAAPLVSREYEAGTHRLAWTQSVSPLRWITLKILLIFGVVVAAAAAIGALVTWTLDPLTTAFGGRYNSTWYDIQGVVPVACMLFALAVGVAASAWIRHTIPAMAATLVVYAAARIPIHWIRAHFWATSSITTSTPLSALLQDPQGDPRSTLASGMPTGGWFLKTTILDPSGHSVRSGVGNLDLLLRYCPDLPRRGPISDEARASCAPHLNGRLRAVTQYQPASHFWLLQAVESAIFLLAAAALVAAAVLAVTRRRPS
jgi:hypothetical protein